MKYLVKFIMNCSLLILTLSIFNSKVNTHLLGKTKNFLKSNNTNGTNGTNSTDMLNKFKDFPIRIDLEWTDDNYILNLHFKLIDGKPLQIENGKKNRRNINDTLHEKSQRMMVEKLIAGNYVLFTQKFDSFEEITESQPRVRVYSGEKSIYNITAPLTKSKNVDWRNSTFWEIGIFKFENDHFNFENRNAFKNVITENYN